MVEVLLLLMQGVYKALFEGGDFKALELAVERVVQEATRRLLVVALEAKDGWLMEHRGGGLRLVGVRRRRLLTKVGEVVFRRRYYVDRGTGQGRFLLDEVLGLRRRQRYSPAVRELAVELAVEMSFGSAARWLERWTQGAVGLSRMAIWGDVQEAGGAAVMEAEGLREAVFGRGEVPEGGRGAEALFLEFDELHVRGRRGRGGRRERVGLKHALAYEGREEDGRGGAVLVHRRVHVAVGDGEGAVEQALADFGRHWEFSRVGRCTVGGDGARWIRKAREYLPPGTGYRLDRFHLRRALREGLGHDVQMYGGVCEALAAGKSWAEVDRLLQVAWRRARGERRRRVQELRGYLEGQWEGIVADQDTRGLGAIEAENYHVLAKRMKRRGAAWSGKGAHHMGRLRAAQANGELERYTWVSWRRCPELLATSPRPSMVREVAGVQELEDAAAWLRARVPALYGPHAGRPWVEVLRQLVSVRSPVA